jgi:hypothetical protein
MAEAPFFADYYLRPVPAQPSESAKYKLADALFHYVGHITSFRYAASDVVITNLCNSPLPHAPRGKIVLIPIEEARAGVEHLRRILKEAEIQLILAMSEQVNYWLQELGFCEANNEYLKRASPKAKGVNSDPPYYEPKSPGAFRLICGRRHLALEGIPLFPIVHVKNWPLRGAFVKAYGRTYVQMISELKRIEGGA